MVVSCNFYTNRIFIYPDPLMADVSIEMSNIKKQPAARWRRTRASQLLRLQNIKSAVIMNGVCESYVGDCFLHHSYWQVGPQRTTRATNADASDGLALTFSCRPTYSAAC